MNARTTAIAVGALYIVGTLTGVLSLVSTGPLFATAGYLAAIAADGSRVAGGVLLALTMGLSLALVPILMFPILRRHDEALAIGYVVFRGGLETFTYLALVISWLSLLPLSRAAAQAGATAAANYEALGALLLASASTAANVTEIVFPLGALMFYFMLFQTTLVPRWVSGWGLVAVFPYLAAGLLLMFRAVGAASTLHTVLVIPMALQEMVLAVWLIAKGFNPAAIAAQPARMQPAKA